MVNKKIGIKNIGKNKKHAKNKNNNKQLLKQEKVSSKKIFKISLIVLLTLIVLVLLFLLISYNLINKKIYDTIANSNEEVINVNYKFNNLILWNKTISYIKDNKKNVYICKDNYSYLLDNEKLEKTIHFKASIKNNYKNLDGFSDYSNVYISINKGSDSVKAISIPLDRSSFSNEYVDIYTYSNNNYTIYQSAEKINSDKIEIELLNKEYNHFLVAYIPVNSIDISSKEFNIKRGMTEEVSIKVMPENATNRTLYFESSDENIAKISGNNIQAIKSGQATINVRIHNEDMAESISVNVLEILNDIKLNRTNATLYIGGSVTITATLVPDNAVNKDLEWISSDESIATVENGKITAKKLGKCNIKVKNTSEPIIERDITVNVVKKPSFPSPGQGAQNANLTYINGILVVNKKYSVPSTYSPGINPTAYNAYIALKNAANAAGFSMPLISGYRSYQTQTNLYNRYVAQYGESIANTFSAKPGQSEHQTGLAFDVGSIDNNYGNTPAGTWLAQNAHKFGFIIRYPKGKESITGYQYEPWHIRYLGTSVATDIYNKGVCLEEYLGI